MDFQKWISRLGSEIILLEINYFQASFLLQQSRQYQKMKLMLQLVKVDYNLPS